MSVYVHMRMCFQYLYVCMCVCLLAGLVPIINCHTHVLSWLLCVVKTYYIHMDTYIAGDTCVSNL